MMFDSISDQVEQRLGNYRLLRLLVRLSFADVYLGEHVTFNNPVVLRVFRITLPDKDSEDFLREAQILASLDHPHIVRILDVAVEGGVPFVVIDSTSHKTLRHRHPPGARLAPDTIVAYLKHIASALRYVHDQNFIHRNVQPGSMLLGIDDKVILGDFSLAFLAHHTIFENTQAMAETIGEALSYMAPEQLQGKPQLASDQYALGVVVYEWLSGRRPFSGSPLEIIRQHLSAEPPSLREQVPGLSPALEGVVFKALAKKPEQRFATVQDFVLALQQAYEQQWNLDQKEDVDGE